VAESNESKALVLIVEDEVLIRMNSVDMIREFGFEVIEAGDADEAVSTLEAFPDVGLVFTDIQMAGSMDGLRLAAVIRDRWPPVALLITSGRVRPPLGDMPAGARFIAKPYSPSQLQEELRSLTGA
jgi:CheY-like chemotaxis protein